VADLTDPAPSRTARIAASWASAPVAVRIGIIYVASRLVTTAFFFGAAALAGRPTSADVAALTLRWDAQWYWFIAVNGYPTDLPLTDTGAVAENPWAFMPIYAYLSDFVGAGLGSWGAGAVVVSLVAGYLACLALHRLLRERIGGGATLWAVAFFAGAPVAALFQVGYAEALALLWLFLALVCVVERRYAWLYVLIPLLGFTRPGVLAFALLLALHGIHRWFRRRDERLSARDIVLIVTTGLWAVAVGFSWQVIAAVVTGNPQAYLLTELAWRRNWLGEVSTQFVPLEGFIAGAQWWFTLWGPGPVVGVIVLVALVAAFAAALLFDPRVKKLGVDVRLWSASYAVYLLLVFFPQSSTFRLLVPLSPLWGAVAVPRSRWWRFGMLAACLAGQWLWIWTMYGLGVEFWQIP
jgi:hypothetical protein